MFDGPLRTFKERVFLPFAHFVARSGATPTLVTLIGFVFGLLASVAAARELVWWASALWWIGRIFDGLDGTLARLTNQESDFGGYVDIVCDFTIYAAIPIAVVLPLQDDKLRWLILCVLLSTYFVNAAGLFLLSALVEKRSVDPKKRGTTSVVMPRGIVEGFETMVANQLFILFPQHASLLMGIFATLVAATILMRIRWAQLHIT